MVTNTEIISCLKKGSLTILGEFLWGSNYTFLAQIAWENKTFRVVFKPIRGERPLWDFPTASLAKREAAAYIVSETIGWGLVPPTIYRKNTPLGPGSIQLFIDHDPGYNFFNFSHADRERLRPAVLFDIIINNADRKGSHILKDAGGKLWLIDHGVCFHIDDKLRTVIWDFAGEKIPNNLLSDIALFYERIQPGGLQSTEFCNNLKGLLKATEIEALEKRAERLVSSGKFPQPNPNRRSFPWPQI